MKRFCFAVLLLASASVLPRPVFAADDFRTKVTPILKDHCFECHSGDQPKGDVRLDTLSDDMINDRPAMETWHDALTAIQLGEMPPDDAKPLSRDDRQVLLSWIRENVDLALESVNGRASREIVLRRLNRAEYAYTMTDLLGLEMDYGVELPPDPISKDGFLNNGESLGMSSMQLQIYLNEARRALAMVLVEGEKPERVVEPIKHNKKFKLKRAATDYSDQLGRAQKWIGTSQTLPKGGPFTVRVRVRTNWKAGQPEPRLGLRFGYFVGGLTTQFLEDVGEINVTSNESAVVEFKGRAEFLPKPESSLPKEKLQTLFVLTNTLDDGMPLPKQVTITPDPDPVRKDSDDKKKKAKKKKAVKVYPRDPDFPQIFVESVEFVMNDYRSWPPKMHQAILPLESDLTSQDGIQSVLESFLTRAWRRLPTSTELDVWSEHYRKIRAVSDTDIQALRETLAASLSSTPFLYLVEPLGAESKEDREERLKPSEIASRLSYFLWSSTPDSELLGAARSGALSQREVLLQQFDRMLGDSKFDRFVDQFCTQWLDLDSLQRIAVNPQYYKKFDDEIKKEMVAESKLFFKEILHHDLSAMHLLDSDFTMLNAKLAKHYGITGPKSQDFVRVSLQGTDRPGGLLGHASMHMAGSDGVDSHPIKRAVWIRERLLDDPPDPPPPNVPSIESSVKNFQKLTVREQLQTHRQKASCADCHRSIDPWGIALEHYDAIGLRREKDARKRKSVDAKTTLPGNHDVSGVRELQEYLLKQRKDQFAEALVAKLLSYALGRSLDISDRPAIGELAERFADNDYKLAELMRDIVSSDPFLSR